MTETRKCLQILGTRGIPASHGGFETFAERLALYLVDRGWRVVVYCQEVAGTKPYTDQWNGIELVHIPARLGGAAGTLEFDLKAALAAAGRRSLVLTLGYNSAVFNVIFRLRRVANLINMDGLEWKRQKWGPVAKTWFYVNERLGCWFGHHLIADHPQIKTHLETRTRGSKITMIPYGADVIDDAPVARLQALGLEPNSYAVVIARPEPENSLLEIVTAFSRQTRGIQLVVLGTFDTPGNAYHARVQAAASDEVLFPGAIYEQDIVAALRFHARFYVHGHTVGGTNPSLVEAMGAGSPVLAHDNVFNRWVAGEAAEYFSDVESCADCFDHLVNTPDNLSARSQVARQRFDERFQWATVLNDYERLLLEWA